MSSEKERELVLVTGANGQIGQAVCLLLRAQGLPLLATDIAPVDSLVREAGFRDFMKCDLTSRECAAPVRIQPNPGGCTPCRCFAHGGPCESSGSHGGKPMRQPAPA